MFVSPIMELAHTNVYKVRHTVTIGYFTRHISSHICNYNKYIVN